MYTEDRTALSLLLLRLSVFAVMLVWAIDKFVRPQHAAAVYENFYLIKDLGENIFYIIGALELLLLAGFVVGFKKRWTYGTVLVLHAVSTLSSYKQYMTPYQEVNLLFFAAWPMLAACFALYFLRDLDTRLVVDRL